MGKKKGTKRGIGESLEDMLNKPWCYYCNKQFEDLKILTDHQKQKHYKCNVGSCHRRLYTAGGLRVHMQQVHKEELQRVENALEGREDPNVEIFGMEGIPEQIMRQHQDLITQQYFQMEAEYRQRTGNSLHQSGGAGQPVAKKPKLEEESKDDLKARVRALKAKKEAEKAARAAGDNGERSASGTPSQSEPIHSQPSELPQPPEPAQRHQQHPTTSFPAPIHMGVPGGWAPPTSASPPMMGGYGGPPVHFPPVYNGYPAPGMPRSFAGPPMMPSHSPILSHPPTGLPQRPPPTSFSHLTAQLHHNLPPRPNVALPRPIATGVQSFDSVEAMIDHAAQVANSDEYRKKREAEELGKHTPAPTPIPAAATATPPIEPAPAAEDDPENKGTAKTKKREKEIMKLQSSELSWEEARAGLDKYRKKSLAPGQQTVGQATDALTGVVDDDAGESMS